VAATEREFAAAIRWFPATGAVVGAAAAGGLWLGAWLILAGGAGGLAAWVRSPGRCISMAGRHGRCRRRGAQDRARLSAVLADPHIGSFGVVAIGLQLLAKLVLLHALARSARAGWWRWPWWRASALAWALALPLAAGWAACFARAARRHLAIWGVAAACAVPLRHG
jgi:adenosylcobinamide-GDP ribazoletransferase